MPCSAILYIHWRCFMTYYANNQKEYRKKLLQFQLRYFLNDKNEGERLKSYLKNVNMSYSNYIKPLIKADLDAKGIPYPELSDNIE